MARLTEEQVKQALSAVQDPDLRKDIVSLGFVKNMQIDGDKISFDVELTTPACPVKDQLKQQCETIVSELGFSEISVNMTARVRSAPVSGKRQIPGVRNLIAVASGKGGVGKSTTAANLALSLADSGARVGILDCDLYGPSVPAMFDVHDRVGADAQQRIIPHKRHGLTIMSMGFVVPRDQAVAWRGPMLSKMIGQFLYSVLWGELDYLILDLPPGTGDVHLSLAQTAPISGAVIVTTPQNVALRDVERGIQMFRQMKVPVLGIVENMSYYLCGNCSKKHYIFGKEGGSRIADRYQLPLLGEIPLDPKVPSELGVGEPILLRAPDSPPAAAYHSAAGQIVSEMSKISTPWATPGPGAMEV